MIMLLPFVEQNLLYFFFALGIDNVDYDLFGLQKPINSMASLNPVVELVINA